MIKRFISIFLLCKIVLAAYCFADIHVTYDGGNIDMSRETLQKTIYVLNDSSDSETVHFSLKVVDPSLNDVYSALKWSFLSTDNIKIPSDTRKNIKIDFFPPPYLKGHEFYLMVVADANAERIEMPIILHDGLSPATASVDIKTSYDYAAQICKVSIMNDSDYHQVLSSEIISKTHDTVKECKGKLQNRVLYPGMRVEEEVDISNFRDDIEELQYKLTVNYKQVYSIPVLPVR